VGDCGGGRLRLLGSRWQQAGDDRVSLLVCREPIVVVVGLPQADKLKPLHRLLDAPHRLAVEETFEFTPWPRSPDARVNRSITRERPARGARIEPWQRPSGQGYELFPVLRVTRPGTLAAPYLLVHYRVGTTQYAKRLPRGVVVCAQTPPPRDLDCRHRLADQQVDAGSTLTG
jgi:hypothetical protein